MKNSLKKLITIGILLFSGNVYSGESGWVHDVDVFRLVVVINGGVNVRVTPDLAGCTSQSGYGEKYASIKPDHPGLDKIYSGLLAAQIAGKKVSLYLGDVNCTVTEIVVGGRH